MPGVTEIALRALYPSAAAAILLMSGKLHGPVL